MQAVPTNLTTHSTTVAPGFSAFHKANLVPDSEEVARLPQLQKILEEISRAYASTLDADLAGLGRALGVPENSIISVADLGLQGDCYLGQNETGLTLDATLLLTTPFCGKSEQMKSSLKSLLELKLTPLGVTKVVVRDQFENMSELVWEAEAPTSLSEFRNQRESAKTNPAQRKLFVEKTLPTLLEAYARDYINVESLALAFISARASVECNPAWFSPSSLAKWKIYEQQASQMSQDAFSKIESFYKAFATTFAEAERFSKFGLPDRPKIKAEYEAMTDCYDPNFILLQKMVLDFYRDTVIDLSKESVAA